MTARAQAREVEQFIALGAQGVISKPFDPMTLASEVQGHLQAAKRDLNMRAIGLWLGWATKNTTRRSSWAHAALSLLPSFFSAIAWTQHPLRIDAGTAPRRL